MWPYEKDKIPLSWLLDLLALAIAGKFLLNFWYEYYCVSWTYQWSLQEGHKVQGKRPAKPTCLKWCSRQREWMYQYHFYNLCHKGHIILRAIEKGLIIKRYINSSAWSAVYYNFILHDSLTSLPLSPAKPLAKPKMTTDWPVQSLTIDQGHHNQPYLLI